MNGSGHTFSRVSAICENPIITVSPLSASIWRALHTTAGRTS
ncbi:hypothetical protein L195_g031496 [Trifolium pratense]|uniref:Uncharacterized protein n=1 Tax=Trifolium pratense TaxID=57577 RepID=A0A2K3LAJ6_TRIPR|nr:hypothetical protein L195_g031496 [Trifolium pratense]